MSLSGAQSLFRWSPAAVDNDNATVANQSVFTPGASEHEQNAPYDEPDGVSDFEHMEVDEWSKEYLGFDGMGNDQFASFDATHGLDTGEHQVPGKTHPADGPFDPVPNFYGSFSGGGEPSELLYAPEPKPAPSPSQQTSFAVISEPEVFNTATDLPEEHHRFAHSGQHGEGDRVDESASDNDQADHLPRRPQGQGACKDPTKQCEHGSECSRPARRVPGKFGGRQLCSRHGTQWENKNCGPPVWQPLVVPTDQAVAIIRPNIVPLREYIRPRAHGQSLDGHRDGLAMWTVRFHQAAMKPYQGEGEERADPYGLLAHQGTFERKAKSRRHQEYRQEMIGARVSLLFPIAWRHHQGGPAIYGTGGDNSGYRADTHLSFLERLQLIESVLKVNKRVVMDVIEGRGVEAFVRGPRDFDKRKRTNKKGNVARQERNATAEGEKSTESQQPSAALQEPGPAPETEESEAFSSSRTRRPRAATAVTRKRKRQLKEDADGQSDGATFAKAKKPSAPEPSTTPDDRSLAPGAVGPEQLLPGSRMTTEGDPGMAVDGNQFLQPTISSGFRWPTDQLLVSAPTRANTGFAVQGVLSSAIQAHKHRPQMVSTPHRYSSPLPGRPVGASSFPTPQIQQTLAPRIQAYHSLPQTPQMLHLSQHRMPPSPNQLEMDYNSAMQSMLAASRSVLERYNANGRAAVSGDAGSAQTPTTTAPSQQGEPTGVPVMAQQLSAEGFGQCGHLIEPALHVGGKRYASQAEFEWMTREG